MTSSMTPSPRRPSAGASFDSRSRRGWPSASDAERLADDDGLGAAAADPALDVPSGWTMPDAPGPRRGRPPDRHDRGDRERPAGRLELGGPREDGPSGHARRRPWRA